MAIIHVLLILLHDEDTPYGVLLWLDCDAGFSNGFQPAAGGSAAILQSFMPNTPPLLCRGLNLIDHCGIFCRPRCAGASLQKPRRPARSGDAIVRVALRTQRV